MSDTFPRQPEDAAPNSLLQEAIDWCIRMNGEDAEMHRAGFDAWLALGGVHRQVYSEVSELHGFGERLRQIDIDRPPSVQEAGRSLFSLARWSGAAVTATLVIAMAIGAFYFDARRATHQERQAKADIAIAGQLQTALGEIRTVRLRDGSMVTLDTDTLLTFDLGGGERRFSLRRGRARFAAASAARPFVVSAGDGTIVAFDSIFDVGMMRSAVVDLSILRGAAQFITRDKWAAARSLSPMRIATGYRTSYGQNSVPAIVRMAKEDISSANWPSGVMPFDGVPLAEVIRQANRYGVIKIILAEPSLGRHRFHGTLRLADTRPLAAALAHAFSLRIDETQGVIQLSQR